MSNLKEPVADLTLGNRLLKKARMGMGRPRKRYATSEKLEIVHLVERWHLPVRRAPDKLGNSQPTVYRWYDLPLRSGEIGLKDRRAGPRRV